jgi:hypothetical protein
LILGALKIGANGVDWSDVDEADYGCRNGRVHAPGGGCLDRARTTDFHRLHCTKSRGRRFDPQMGGVRKVRWSRQGTGKRGGVRVIYFYHAPDMPLYLLMVYAKAQRDDLSLEARRTVQALVARLKSAQGR